MPGDDKVQIVSVAGLTSMLTDLETDMAAWRTRTRALSAKMAAAQKILRAIEPQLKGAVVKTALINRYNKVPKPGKRGRPKGSRNVLKGTQVAEALISAARRSHLPGQA